MNINQSQLIELIHQGEGLMMEFKKCRNQLNKDVYETVCAFLNRHGGTLLLGINDDGEILGIDPDSIVQIKKDFVTAINNAQKINPPAYLSVEEVEIDPQQKKISSPMLNLESIFEVAIENLRAASSSSSSCIDFG